MKVDSNHLHLFITDELFVIPEENMDQVEAEVQQEDLPIESDKPEQKITQQPLKDFLVISEPLSSDGQSTLNRLLDALKLESAPDIRYEWAEDQNLYKRVLTLGYESNLEEAQALYSVSRIDTTEYLRAPSIDKLDQNRAAKVELWNALKDWFNL